MKKLESLKNEKYVVSQDEMLQIKGGYDVTPSYRTHQTVLGDGRATVDYEAYDVCIS
jgi:hypothetical protein